MQNKHKNSPDFQHKERGKDTKKQRLIQLKKVKEAFLKQPATMLMIAQITQIERANICRYVDILEKQNEIAFIEKSKCPITKHRAGFYTTNKNLFPQRPIQGKLFE